MADQPYDLVVIGAGSGGVRAARVAAGLGARVAIVEHRRLGGTCVNVGCVPKKLMVYASRYGDALGEAAAFGWPALQPTHRFAALMAAKDAEIARLNGVYAKLLDDAGVERFEGQASLKDAHTVAVGERLFGARHILLAVGGRPRLPDIEGAELALTSDDIFALRERPARLVICGGGYIGCEFASIFHGLGSQVTQIYRGALFLRRFDRDLRQALADEMAESGIALRFERQITALGRVDSGIEVALDDGTTLECDAVLYAIGRAPATDELGLGRAGVATGPGGYIAVDARSRTNVEHIYAAGDVTGRVQLTPMAIAEGAAVAETLFGTGPQEPDHTLVPTAVFTTPEIGTVGLTEAEARARGGPVRVFRSRFRPMRHTITGLGRKMLMKLVVDGETLRVLGCHVLGEGAAEIVQGFAVALRCGATKRQLDQTLGIHPTAAEEPVTMRTEAGG